MQMSNGKDLPMIGFGTYLATANDGKENIRRALEAGYRYLDTAAFYFNETEIGEAIRESNIAREDLFIASKVWVTDLGYDSTLKSCRGSLERLGTDYLDLYLIHWPRPDMNEGWEDRIRDTWRAMERLYRDGIVKAIGVSNFLPHHLAAIEETMEISPMVNQLELHVGYMQECACAYCRERGIALQAWSPLGRSKLLSEDAITSLAAKYNVSPARLLLRFLVQQDIAVIPKSSSLERMTDNMDIFSFEITKEDMSFLRCLPQMGWSGEHPDFFTL